MQLLIATLIASQILLFPNLSFRWCKEVTAQAGIVLILCSLIFKRNKSIALFMLWCMFLFMLTKSLVVNDYNNIPEYKVNLLSFFNIINVVLYGVLYWGLHEMRLDVKKLAKALCFIAIFQTGYVLLQKVQLDQFFYSISILLGPAQKKVCWPVGTWGNEALVSWCIAICSPYFLMFKELRYKIGYGLSFVAVVFTGCSSGIAGFILGYLFWLFFKKRKLFYLLTVCLLLVFCVLLESGQLKEYFNPTHRFEVWKKSVEIWKEQPITGHGLGSYRVKFWNEAPEFRDDGHWAQAHNDYVQLLFETGIVGLALFMSLIWIAYLQFWRSRVGVVPMTSFTVALAVAMFSFPFHTAMGVLPLTSLVLFEREYYGFRTDIDAE